MCPIAILVHKQVGAKCGWQILSVGHSVEKNSWLFRQICQLGYVKFIYGELPELQHYFAAGEENWGIGTASKGS